MKNVIKSFGIVCLGLLSLTMLSGCGMEQINEGYRGIYTWNGAIQGAPKEPGLHFYMPFFANIREISVQETRLDGQTEAFTSDTQAVDLNFSVTYYPRPKKIGELWSKFGVDWANKVVGQVVLGAMKDSIGKYKAGDLVGKREEAAHAATKSIQVGLEDRGIVVTRLDFTNLNFKEEYEHAIQEKLTAVEKANAEKNKTVQVEEQARQTIASAKAEAEAMRIKSAALSQNKGLVAYEIALKWNGVLPQMMLGTGTTPMLDLRGLTKQVSSEE